MPTSLRIFFVLLIAMTILALYQNCGRQATASSASNSLNDRVTKISGPADASDDELLSSEFQKLSSPNSENLSAQLEICQKSMGEDRRLCLWERVKDYYRILGSEGWTVSNELSDCFVAVSKNPAIKTQPLHIVSTCQRNLSQYIGAHLLHLGDCLKIKDDSTNLSAVSNVAELEYLRSRYFEHLNQTVVYENSGDKLLQGLLLDQVGASTFKDACGELIHGVPTNLSLGFTVQ